MTEGGGDGLPPADCRAIAAPTAVWHDALGANTTRVLMRTHDQIRSHHASPI